MLSGLTFVNFSEMCWSHHKNYEWRLNRDFVHIFNLYIFLKLVRTIKPRNFFFNKKIHLSARGGSEEHFLQQEKRTPVQEGDSNGHSKV